MALMRTASIGASVSRGWAAACSASRRTSDTVPISTERTTLAEAAYCRSWETWCWVFHLAGSRDLASGLYGLVGVGVLRSDLESFDELVGLDNTEVAWNFGGGVMIFFGSHVGIRGDVRYFRTFSSLNFGTIQRPQSEVVDYGRGSLGLVFRF